MSKIKEIFLVDGDFRRRAAITHNLAKRRIHVEPFENSEEFIAHWPRERTQTALLVHDAAGAVVRLLREIARSGQWLPVIGFAGRPESRNVVEAVLEGAIDYVAWPFTDSELADVIEAVAAKAQSIGSAKLREALARSRVERLTRREREVLVGVASGMSNRLIGKKLAISPRTVEIHRANMLTKMSAKHTSEAIRIAIEAAIVY
ncbi:MAG: LuxR family transcriptional regulator [Sphingomonadales bacterium]|nr:LuxR family transcriptional regulator [Sphingomonadales bacterium]